MVEYDVHRRYTACDSIVSTTTSAPLIRMSLLPLDTVDASFGRFLYFVSLIVFATVLYLQAKAARRIAEKDINGGFPEHPFMQDPAAAASSVEVI